MHDHSLTALSGLIASGDLTPTDLTAACLARIEALNPALNAYLTVMVDPALAQAEALTAERKRGKLRGPLHGIPLAVKDNIDVAGVVTSAGSPFLKDNRAAKDAPVVARLREAGAVILGKTNLHEWAQGATTINPHTGPTRNPWNPALSPGGSSGGSAAAVAAGLGAGALGTDTGGSVRLPAAFCNLVGLRPVRGSIPAEGVIPASPTLDVVGPLARTAADCALLYGVMSGSDLTNGREGEASFLKPRPYRMGVPEDGFFWERTDPEIGFLFGQALETFANLGLKLVRAFSLPDLKAAARAAGLITAYESSAYHRDRLESAPELFGADVRALLERGAAHTEDEYRDALRTAGAWGDSLTRLLTDQADLIAVPTVPVMPPRIDEPEGDSIKHLLRFTFPFSAGGLPSLSLPCGFSPAGTPVGMQLLARDVETLFRAAGAYEAVTAWTARRPPGLPAM
jgi:aspartyl-tRNA(Asn)/glutamyl-tRNA(Gln) amidotransferase subunit A